MTETKTPGPTSKTPSPSPGVSQQPTVSQSGSSPRGQFITAVMGMSWQLAVVVLVPILGGYFLDQQFATTPLLTMLGFIIAMTGFGLIVWRQLQRFTPSAANQTVKPTVSETKGSSK